MCGIFAFTGAVPDESILEEIITEASSRGPHAWGVAWLEDGRLRRLVDTTPLRDHVQEALEAVRRSPVSLGHARLATTAWGGRDDPEQVQPLVADGIALAHNGTIADAEAVRTTHDLPPPRTGNDSEVLLQLLARREGDSRERMAKALQEIGGATRAHAAVAIDLEAGVLAASTGQPLYRLDRSEGTYLCSRRVLHSVRLEQWAS